MSVFVGAHCRAPDVTATNTLGHRQPYRHHQGGRTAVRHYETGRRMIRA